MDTTTWDMGWRGQTPSRGIFPQITLVCFRAWQVFRRRRYFSLLELTSTWKSQPRLIGGSNCHDVTLRSLLTSHFGKWVYNPLNACMDYSSRFSSFLENHAGPEGSSSHLRLSFTASSVLPQAMASNPCTFPKALPPESQSEIGSGN